MPISHNNTPRMVQSFRVYGGVTPAPNNVRSRIESSSARLRRDHAAARRFELEGRRQQGLGVVGLGLGEHGPRRALLHHLAVTQAR